MEEDQKKIHADGRRQTNQKTSYWWRKTKKNSYWRRKSKKPENFTMREENKQENLTMKEEGKQARKLHTDGGKKCFSGQQEVWKNILQLSSVQTMYRKSEYLLARKNGRIDFLLDLGVQVTQRLFHASRDKNRIANLPTGSSSWDHREPGIGRKVSWQLDITQAYTIHTFTLLEHTITLCT